MYFLSSLIFFFAPRAFGFGDGFVSWVGLLYNGAQCMVKMGEGIWQGCPLLGQLYSLVIEPLLCRLRSRLGGLPLPGSSGIEHPPAVSAYADDVYTFVFSPGDGRCLQDTLTVYEKASCARVNHLFSSPVCSVCGAFIPSNDGQCTDF